MTLNHNGSEPAGRLIAISDVHGCVHALDTVLEAINAAADDWLVFVGDLIDQGRDSKDVLQRVIDLKSRCRVDVIEGNHEEMILAARGDLKAQRYWERCGGVQTLNSYRFGAGLDEIPKAHWDLIESALPFIETSEFLFTHANYTPELLLSGTPTHQLRWALFEPDELRPHVSGKTVIVGHTEQSNSEILDLGFALCIDTACWRHGWLTALDVKTRKVWQASRWGVLRAPHEPTHRGLIPQLATPTPAVA